MLSPSLALHEIASSTDRLDLWSRVLKATQGKHLAEVGVWKGDFAKHLLENCPSIQTYYMVDPWANLPDWNKPGNVKQEFFDKIYEEARQKTAFAAEKRIILRGRTTEVIDQIPDSSLDFAYIDGDHTLRGITIDLIKLFPKIREGGFIGGDDFINDPWQHPISFEPTLVCPYSVYFAEAIGQPIWALPFSQFLIQKDRATPFLFTDLAGKYSDLSLNKPLPGLRSRLSRALQILRFGV